jgi:hypothetical protein
MKIFRLDIKSTNIVPLEGSRFGVVLECFYIHSGGVNAMGCDEKRCPSGPRYDLYLKEFQSSYIPSLVLPVASKAIQTERGLFSYKTPTAISYPVP